MRVTDVDELRERIARITCVGGWSKRILIQFLDEVPTIELVRCGECVYKKFLPNEQLYMCKMTLHRFYKTDQYCSYGKKVDDDQSPNDR